MWLQLLAVVAYISFPYLYNSTSRYVIVHFTTFIVTQNGYHYIHHIITIILNVTAFRWYSNMKLSFAVPNILANLYTRTSAAHENLVTISFIRQIIFYSGQPGRHFPPSDIHWFEITPFWCCRREIWIISLILQSWLVSTSPCSWKLICDIRWVQIEPFSRMELPLISQLCGAIYEQLSSAGNS